MKADDCIFRWTMLRRITRMALPAVGLFLMGLISACSEYMENYEPAAATYAANKDRDGAFAIPDPMGSGEVTLPAAMIYRTTSELSSNVYEHEAKVRAWSYRYKWVQNGQTYTSSWVDTGKNADGSPICRFTLRPSDSQALREAMLQSGAGPVQSIVCETVARVPALGEPGEWVQEIPIPVVVTGP